MLFGKSRGYFHKVSDRIPMQKRMGITLLQPQKKSWQPDLLKEVTCFDDATISLEKMVSLMTLLKLNIF